MDEGRSDKHLDLIWGVDPIAAEVGLTRRQTYHMLENGRLPAKKVGGRWCASRKGLRAFFSGVVEGELHEREIA